MNISKPREWRIQEALMEVLREFECTPEEAKNLCADAVGDFTAEYENRAEAAWDAHQQSLMETGGPDDSHYRQQMKDAGRGHLLR